MLPADRRVSDSFPMIGQSLQPIRLAFSVTTYGALVYGVVRYFALNLSLHPASIESDIGESSFVFFKVDSLSSKIKLIIASPSFEAIPYISVFFAYSTAFTGDDLTGFLGWMTPFTIVVGLLSLVWQIGSTVYQ